MTTKLYPFVFQDSGKRISYRKVSYNLSNELRKVFPAPKPPIITVSYDTGPRQEANPNDPAYVEALKNYHMEFEGRLRQVIVKRGTVIVLTDEDKRELNELRETMAELGVELPKSDNEAWLFHIAISTPEEYQELLNAITRRSMPTEEAVAEKREQFRPEDAVALSEGSDAAG